MGDSKAERRSVFIGGASRSGTTMLGAMLGSHSQMFATPESQFKFDIAPIFDTEDISSDQIRQSLVDHPRFKVWKFAVDWASVDMSTHSSLMVSILDQYAGWKHKKEALFWIDHTPTNLRHSQFLNDYYPECYFIHIVRDGRAVMASQFSLDWGSNDPVFAAMKWIEPLCVGLACESAFPSRCMRVHYEQLVLHPEQECRRICGFLGLDYEPDMIRGEGFDVPSFTKSNHQLVGQLPDPGRIEHWKQTLKREDLQIFESLTFDLLPMLGYQKAFPGFVPKPTEAMQALILFKGALKYLTFDRWRRKIRINREKRLSGE